MNRLITLISHYVLALCMMAQQDGTLDQSFANKGVFTKDLSNPEYAYRYQESYKLHKLRDGSILTFDFYSPIGGVFNCKITKFDRTGKVDTSFGENGVSIMDRWANMGISIIKIDEGTDGTLFILCDLMSSYQLATLNKNGNKLSWSPYFDVDSNKKTIPSLPLTGLLLPSNYYLVAIKDSIIKYDRNSNADPSFHCKLKQVVGLFATPEPNKYLTFAIDNKQLIARQILDNGIIDPDFQPLNFDLNFEPTNMIISSGHFYFDFQHAEQLNDSIYAFVMMSVWERNTAKSFKINLKSKTISTIKDIVAGNEYGYDKAGNVWSNTCDSYNTGGKPLGLYNYKDNGKTDTLKINGGFFLAGDTLYTTNILQKSRLTWPVDPAPNKAFLNKYINGLPDLSFGNQGSVTYLLSYDHDAAYQSIRLSDSYLINSVSGGYFSYIYRLLDNGITAPVDIQLGKLKQIHLLKKSQLLQQGADIFLISDSMIYKYDVSVHTFKEYVAFTTRSSVYSHTPGQFLVANTQGIRSINILSGDASASFGTEGIVSLSFEPSRSFESIEQIFTDPTGAFRVFKRNGTIYSFDAKGKPNPDFGTGGQLAYTEHILHHGTSRDLFAKIENDSILSFEVLDSKGNISLSSDKIYLGNKISTNNYDRALDANTSLAHAVLQNDGKYVVAISINRNKYWDQSTSGGLYFTKLLRLNTDLSLDKSFGDQGYLELVGHAMQLHIAGDKAYLSTNTAESQVMNKLTMGDNTVYKIHLGAKALDIDDDLAYENTTKIYPNPTTGLVRLVGGALGQDLAQIYNSIGVRVASIALNDNTLDLSHLNKGMYIVKVGNDAHMVVKE